MKNKPLASTVQDTSRIDGAAKVGGNELTQRSHLTEEGKIRVRLTSESFARYPQGEVLDCFGKVIGEASSCTYGGAAFAVHTKPFAGHVKFSECVFVGGLRGINTALETSTAPQPIDAANSEK